MKRYFILAFLLIMTTIVLISCGQGGDTSTDENTSDIDVTSSTENTTAASTLDTLSETERQVFANMVENNTQRALTIADSTIDKYGTPKMGYILSRYYNPYENKTNGTASVWHYTAYYAMLSRLVDISESSEYEELSDKVYAGFAFYSGTANITTYLGTYETTLYGVNRANQKGKADVSGVMSVYDDQMWIIRETVYRYKQTGDETYLNEAIRLANICINGWDFTLDENGQEYGGIPWGPGYSSKHTCSNAPIIAPLVEIYEILNEKDNASASYYLEWAKKIYTYTKEHLMDTDKLYSDSIGYQRIETGASEGGKKYQTTSMTGCDGTKYSYNTGAMISGAVALYRATENQTYLTDAKSSASAAYRNFRKTAGSIDWYPNHTETVWFNLVLFQGFLDLYVYDPKNAEKYILSFDETLDYVYTHHLKDDLLPRDYINGWNSDSNFDKNVNVMDQASAAQLFAMIAMWAEDVLEADDAKIAGAS